MGATAGKMIDDTLGLLESWSLDEDQATTLDGDITDSALTFTVTATNGTVTGISPGIVEIGQELIYCDDVDEATSICTVPAWGRGYKNTTAGAHTDGSRIVSQPTFPRAKVLDALNTVISRVFPDVFAVKDVNLTTAAHTLTYDLPDDVEWVLQARWLEPNGWNYWRSVNDWRMTPVTNGTLGDRSFDIRDRMVPGQQLNVLYAAKPSSLAGETDDFETITGLDLGLKDVIELGAASMLVTSQETSRLQVSSVEQQNRSQLVAPSAALTTSSALEQRFQMRLTEEQRSLRRLYPPRITGPWK